MIVYIHGASATADSFNHIREHITADGICLEYDSSNGFTENLKEMGEKIKSFDSIFFVGHSLGGIYALHLAKMFPKKVKGGITLSTPYGGSKSADYVKYFLPFCRLLRDIGPTCDPMKEINKIDIKWPWCNVVTTRGTSLFMTEPNDGVVTIKSMKHLASKMEIVELETNHYEVVMSHQAIELIESKLAQAN
jgi:pimeloyl-ACP methyl ester carboxylesterase